jgi:hypothetical protein
MAALREAGLAEARHQIEDFPAQIESLQAILTRVFPPHLIAVLAGWGLRTGLGADGASNHGMIPDLEQHHVELLQAIVLTLPRKKWGQSPAEPEDIQATIDTLVAVAAAFHGRRLLASVDVDEPVAAMLLALQEKVRLHTQLVRNWGYSSDVRRISRAIYSPLDAALSEKLGYGATELLNVITAIESIVDHKVNERFNLLKSILRARSKRQMIRLFFERYPGVQGDPDAYFATLHPQETLTSLRFRLTVYADQRLVICALASVSEVAIKASVDEATARAVMDRLSHPEDALVGQDLERLFLANPVWTRPGIRTGEDYFFAFPQTASSFVHPILRGLIDEAGLTPAYLKHRDAWLETEVARLISTSLPGANVRTGLPWRWEGKRYETDVLAILDRTVVIVEAKSAALSPEGLRGAPGRVKNHIRDLIVEPAEQSARLEGILRRAQGGDADAVRVVVGLGVDIDRLDTIIRLSVTLDDLSVLFSAEGQLKRAGWVPEDLALPATLNVADLGCVADLLGPAHLLHYFAARSRIQKRVNLFGDELDLLGFYLETGFNLNGLPEVGNLTLLDMSSNVDRYYVSRDAGVLLSKPRPRPGELVAPILNGLLERRPEGWATAAIALLDCASHNEQKRLRGELVALRDRVKRTFRDPDHDCACIWTPPDPDDAPIVFHIFPRALASGRYDVMEKIASGALERTGRDRCVVVGRMIEEWDKPFAYIGMAYASA